MNPPPQPPPPYFPGGAHSQSQPSPPKRELNLQGPRPSPLKVSKDSHKIKKPPPVPRNTTSSFPHPAPAAAAQLRQEPVIIYAVSPKVIHADVTDFMSVVQRLTGNPSSFSSGAGDLSPAARLASIEKTSPSDKERERERGGGEDMMGVAEEEGLLEVGGQFPGILSPAPSSLPAIPAGFFSPGWDPQGLSFLQDLSPLSNNNFNNNFFMGSPMVSPSPSSVDLFNLFDL